MVDTMAFRKRHDYLVPALNSLPGVNCLPGAATFYAFPDVTGAIEAIDGVDGDVQFASYLLDEAGVAVVPGSAFGAPGHVRLSFACKLETLEKAIERIRNVLPEEDSSA